jgi:DNA ligase (NAD+)
MTTVAKPANQLSFVITGTLEQSRPYYEELIKNAGHKVSGSVSKKTSYVLVGEDAGSKLTKAQDLGIPLLHSEKELLEVLK